MLGLRSFAVLATAVVMGISIAWAQAPVPPPMLETIRARGHLICGVSSGVAGFSLPDSAGNWRGLDVDLCRAVATTIFGDANKVRFVGLSSQVRFTALQSGEVDLLARNTTFTLTRDISLGFDFVGINFYDGQGFMVRRSAGITSATQLDGATICMQPGTTTELNVADWFRTRNLTFTPVLIEKFDDVNAAFFAGRCDAYTTDQSGLAAVRITQGDRANDYVILPEQISKEPLGPLVRQGDARFADLVRWSLYAMVAAEELGLSSANIEQSRDSANPDIQRFIGRTGDLGQMMGVDNAWAYNIVKQIGNYGESFTRNIAPLGVPRGHNELWTKGGLMYAPPIR